MKKWFCVLSLVLALSIPFSAACADEEMSYETYLPYWERIFNECSTDLLLQMRSVIDVELATREDLDKEVTVPVGIFYVGVDIPVGTYTIKGSEKYTSSYVEICDERGVRIFYESLYNNAQLGRVDLYFGYKVKITGDPVIFAKYKGLGF